MSDVRSGRTYNTGTRTGEVEDDVPRNVVGDLDWVADASRDYASKDSVPPIVLGEIRYCTW